MQLKKTPRKRIPESPAPVTNTETPRKRIRDPLAGLAHIPSLYGDTTPFLIPELCEGFTDSWKLPDCQLMCNA